MDLFTRVAQLKAAGEPFALATVTWREGPTSGQVGAKAVIHLDGTVEGWIGGACATPTVVQQALEALQDGRPRLLSLGEDDPRSGVVGVPMACASEGAMEVYVEPVLPPPHVHVVGDSPMTRILAGMAELLGWRVSTADDVDMGPVGEGSAVVVATQGRYDEPALEAALGTDAAYIGLVASPKRVDAVFEWLRDRGVSEGDLARVRAPAGLDLGPVRHEAISVSILAELVSWEAGGRLQPPARSTARLETVDPVCGMTVDPNRSRFSTTHGGRTFHFCAASCLRTFERDPAAYLGDR
jgi:xanthine dehydrogenase accessory factor